MDLGNIRIAFESCPSTWQVERSHSQSYSTMLANAQNWPTAASLNAFKLLEWEIDAFELFLSTLLSVEAMRVLFFGTLEDAIHYEAMQLIQVDQCKQNRYYNKKRHFSPGRAHAVMWQVQNVCWFTIYMSTASEPVQFGMCFQNEADLIFIFEGFV